MIRISFLVAALAFVALPAFAQGDCGSCTECPTEAKAECSSKKAKAEGTWSKHLAALEAKAAAGDKSAAAALAAACEDCGTDCKKTLTAKVSKLEAKAAAGDEVAKNKLTRMKWAMVFAAVRAEPLSKQVEFYAKACDNGCDVSKKSMSVLMKETGAKDQAELVAKLTAIEAKAAKGDAECKAKIASMHAKLAPKKAAKRMTLSAHAEKLTLKAKAGDKAAQERLAKIAASIEVKPDALVATLREFEAKAGDGCQKCVGKLAKVEMAMKAGKSGDCSDCTKSCDGCDEEKGCDEKAACDKEAKKDCGSCPSESKKPVSG